MNNNHEFCRHTSTNNGLPVRINVMMTTMSRIDDIDHIDNIDNGEKYHELYGFLVDHVLEFRSCFFSTA